MKTTKTTKITFSALALSLTIMGIQPANILANDDITEEDVNIETQAEVETTITEEDIKTEVDQIVDTTKENYDTTVEEVNTNLENRQEEIDTTKENIETTNTEITEATAEKTEIETTTNDTLEDTNEKTEEVIEQSESTYENMINTWDKSFDFWEVYGYDEGEHIDQAVNTEDVFYETKQHLTIIYNQAPTDYEKLYNATIQYGKDYDEEAYNKAIEGIVIPEYDFNDTYEATDNLIEALKPFTDNSATEYIKALEQYKVSVKELADLNYAQTFKDLYTLKGEYDKVRALEQAIAQKEAEVKELEANLEKQEAEYVQAKADGDEKIAEALDAHNKALSVQEKVNKGIYEIILNDPLYTNLNKMIITYTAQNSGGGSASTPSKPKPTQTKTLMYRVYNKNSGEHFYTTNIQEMNYLVSLGWINEGIGWIAPSKSKTPVYRVYNKNAGDHHYTTSMDEKNHLVSLGWNDEGIGWYSDDAKGQALYRQYNPNAIAGSHNYTTNLTEHNYLINAGWNDEGIAWYGLK